MAVIYNSALKSVRMGLVIDAIDGGAGPGTLEIGTSGFAQTLAIITLDDPSFTESGGTITMAGVPKIDASAVPAARPRLRASRTATES